MRRPPVRSLLIPLIAAAFGAPSLAEPAASPPGIEIPGDGAAPVEDQLSGLELHRRVMIAGGTDQRTAQAIVFMEQGRFAEAEGLFRSVIADNLTTPNRFHRHLAGTEVNLGRALSAQGRDDEAELLFRRALERSQRLPDNETDTYGIIRHLGGLLVNQGRFSEAEPLLRKIVSRAGRGSEDSLFAQTAMAYVLLCEGKATELAALLQAIEEQISRFNYGGTYLEQRLRRLQCFATERCRLGAVELRAEASEVITPRLPKISAPVGNLGG